MVGVNCGSLRCFAIRPGNWQSSFQSEYLAQALKRQFVIATLLLLLMKIGPESRVQTRFVGQRWNFTFFRSTLARVSTLRALALSALLWTIMLTCSTRLRWRTMSAYTHGMGSKRPGQSL